MDNARIHKSKIFTAYINTEKNKVLYNIPYCTEINPIEMVFSKVKALVHKKGNNEKIERLIKNIKYGFRQITSKNLKSYYDKCFIK
jgi:transposase